MDGHSVPHRTLSVGFLLSVLGSLFFLQWWSDAPLIVVGIIASGIAIGLIVLFLKKQSVTLATMIAIALGLLLAVLRSWTVGGNLAFGTIAQVPDGTYEITGWITNAPERFPTLTRYIITVDRLRVLPSTAATKRRHAMEEAIDHPITGKILVMDRSGWPQFNVGDAVRVRGNLETPGTIDRFDYAEYLRIDGITKLMTSASVVRIVPKPPAPLGIMLSPLRFLTPLREWYERRITLVLPEPQASLLAGLLTGTQSGMSKRLKDAFRVAGLTHIVAISGSNITIILSLLSGAFFFVPMRRSVLLLIVGISLFALFVGANPPVVRASIMGSLGLFAIRAERRAEPRLLILWTAFGMSLWNPLELWHSASFQDQ